MEIVIFFPEGLADGVAEVIDLRLRHNLLDEEGWIPGVVTTLVLTSWLSIGVDFGTLSRLDPYR